MKLMKVLIDEVNQKLLDIIADLKERKENLEDSLASIQEKIDEKIDEASEYKKMVDASKEEIRILEEEITSLDNDLSELTAKFSNKDLNAILETANKEISSKKAMRNHDINKCRDKINDTTKKAAMLKDLLLNLKQDKELKKAKLDDIIIVLNYYESKLMEIIDFSSNHEGDLLVPKEEEKETFKEEEYEETVVVDDGPVFEEISSIAKTEEDDDFEPKNDEETEVNEVSSTDDTFLTSDDNADIIFNPVENSNDTVNAENVTDDINDFFNSLAGERPSEEELTKEEIQEELPDDEVSDIISLFEHDKTAKIDFKSINDSIDKEYENIFGEKIDEEKYSNELAYVPSDNDFLDFKVSNEKNMFDLDEEIKPLEDKPNDDAAFPEFFKKYNLDLNRFSKEDITYLETNFNEKNALKNIDILINNSIDLENVYTSAKILTMPSLELEKMINKLLLANQTAKNIGLVLETLPEINSYDLNEVIESYGMNAKDTDITELIVKAKHLKDIGGGK